MRLFRRLLFNFGLITDLVDRVDGYESLRIGLLDKFHQLSVFVLVDDRDDLSAGGVVVGSRVFVESCAAVKVVKNVINDNIELCGDHADLSLYVKTKDEMVNYDAAEVGSENAENDCLCVVAQCRGQSDRNSGERTCFSKLNTEILIEDLCHDVKAARRSVVGE